MRSATEAEINDVFGRINTYGHRLSDQERRQAGVQSDFSVMVRELACDLRGDASTNVLPLSSMPSISIDLPMTKHGYEVQAEDVFWVKQGILRSTDLRDSMDEQCIADIAASVVQDALIERSKDALDEIYSESPTSEALATALDIYGADKFSDEFKFCIGEILKICSNGSEEKLRDIIFSKRTTNAFPSVFAVLVFAFHEIIVKEEKSVSDPEGLKKSLRNIADKIDTGRKATSPDERRKNVNIVKGMISSHFVQQNPPPTIYGGHTATDIETIVRRSEIELSDYELKQGILNLNSRTKDSGVISKIIHTICAIANNGKDRSGKIIIGVTNSAADAKKIEAMDSIKPRKVGRRFLVGVSREAKILNISTEKYYGLIRQEIQNSSLSDRLKSSVLSHIDFNSFYGLGVIVISIPPQEELSYVGDDLYWRNGDNTEKATSSKKIADLAKRF